MEPKVSIILLNWNNWKDTLKCLESLFKIDYPHYDVIVIDNGSKDNSIKNIKEYAEYMLKIKVIIQEYDNNNKQSETFEYNRSEITEKLYQKKIKKSMNIGKLIIIKNSKNYGFTKGNNIGIEYALKFLDPNYILLLNNDTIVKKNFLSELVNVAESDIKIGFVGPKIYYYEYPGENNTVCRDIIQYAGASLNLWNFKTIHMGHGEKDIGQYDKINEVDYTHGSCMLVKTQTINDIGLLDEKYVSFREENDWCIRGLKKGWKSYYTYKSVIWHKGGGSTNKKDIQPLVLYYMTRNSFLFMKKHGSNAQKISFIFNFFLFTFWWRIGVSILYFRSFKLVKCYLKSVKDGFNVKI
jgi:GT2 family glycosyltransferase